MREIPADKITEIVKGLFIAANLELEEDVVKSIEDCRAVEDSPIASHVLDKILENAQVAKEESLPLCQDTGLALLFVELGQDVHVTGSDFHGAIEEGVRRAYANGYLRKSICDPLTRLNTGDNTPAVIHTEIVPGDKIRIIAMPKGGGSENMSGATMLVPAAGEEGIKNYVIEMVKKAGPNPCPPIIVGVGIGGDLEKAVILSKKALLRKAGERNPRDPRLARMEEELLAVINALGIGPQGYGGRTTALAVHMEMMPCHIASFPVAVNIQCHVARHKEAVI
ncbi:MAG: fumarate hydratase [Smithellaceae bacterium]|nr:fumarate hydratase [Smithellaceae bacterium]